MLQLELITCTENENGLNFIYQTLGFSYWEVKCCKIWDLRISYSNSINYYTWAALLCLVAMVLSRLWMIEQREMHALFLFCFFSSFFLQEMNAQYSYYYWGPSCQSRNVLTSSRQNSLLNTWIIVFMQKATINFLLFCYF